MNFFCPEFYGGSAKNYRHFVIMLIVMLFLQYSLNPAFSQKNEDTEGAVVATVNGQPILKSTVNLLVEQYKKRSGKQEVTLVQKKEILNSIITRHLILQNPEAQALKNDTLILQKMTAYENNLITSKFITDHVDVKVVVTDEDAKKYYKDNIDKFRSAEKVEIQGMLLKTREEAEKIRAKLNEGGNFTELAKENSIDLATAKGGGHMEVIEKGKGKVFPQIEAAVFKLKPGELSDIIKTDFGFNIFRVEQVYPVSLVPFKEVKNEIKKILYQGKKAEGYDRLSQNLQKNAVINIFENKL